MLFTWLADGRFPSTYRKRAENLASYLCVECEVYDQQVYDAHTQWAKQIHSRLLARPEDEEDPGFWIFALGTLAKGLYRGRCVMFGPPKGQGVDQGLAPHQSLLLNFNDEYAAVDYVRSVHMELYYQLRPSVRELHKGLPLNYSVGRLNDIFQELHRDPEAFLRYVDLLKLPWVNSN